MWKPLKWGFENWCFLRTNSAKINCLGHNIRMYWTNFWQPTVYVQPNMFEKTLIEVGSPHLCASFGTFCAQISQLFEAQCIFEICLKINKLLPSKENAGDFAILLNVRRLTVPRIFDQFGCERCQKKCKYVDYQLL